MAIRGIVIDVSETLIHDGQLVPEAQRFWEGCRLLGLKIIVAATHQSDADRLKQLGLEGDVVASRESLKVNKPSPKYITVPAESLGLKMRELVYIGDSQNDAFCAARAKIPFLRADWAAPDHTYGIPMPDIRTAGRFIHIYLTKAEPWFWSIDRLDNCGRPYRYRTMIDGRTRVNGNGQVVLAARELLKNGVQTYRWFFFYHLIASLHLSGLLEEVDYWTTYPSSARGSTGHSGIAEAISPLAKLFHDTYQPLLLRHTQVRKSHELKAQGIETRFDMQVGSVMLNPAFTKPLAGKRVLVLDDFSTEGYSFEWARNALYNRGATSVICVAIGKFGTSILLETPRAGVTYDASARVALTDDDFEPEAYESYGGRIESAAEELRTSFDLYRRYRSGI